MSNGIKPFDSFKLWFSILWWVGFYKPIEEPKSVVKRYAHNAYRVFACLIVVCFNLQHVLFIAQLDHDQSDQLLESIMTEIPIMNLLLKLINLNIRSSRVDRVNELLNDPVLGPKSIKDEDYLKQNKKEMTRLVRILQAVVIMGAITWPLSFFMRRLSDPTTVLPIYIPFPADSLEKFLLHIFILVFPLYWVGYGHYTMDGLIIAYYAHAAVQLKIVKYNLENLFNSDDGDASNLDVDIKQRFCDCVKRFDKVHWLAQEVTNIFNPCLTFLFFTSSAAMCVVIYKMSMTNVASVEFSVLLLLLLIMVTEVFMCCHYGNIVSFESEYVNNALYLSDWTSATPRTRKLFLIGMVRWTRPLIMRTGGLVPLSLSSFVTIVKSSYTLYTILVSKKSFKPDTSENFGLF